jgi:hypothetical protein
VDDSGCAEYFERTRKGSVVSILTNEHVHAGRLDGHVSVRVGVSELRRVNLEGNSLLLTNAQLNAGEPGELLGRPGHAKGVDSQIELEDYRPSLSTSVRYCGGYSGGTAGVDVGAAVEVA